MKKVIVPFILLLGLPVASSGADAKPPLVPVAHPANSSLGNIDFARQVMPILKENCLECHNAEKRKGGLSLAVYGDLLEGSKNGYIVKPSDSGDSSLIEMITVADELMPKDKDPLRPEQIALIRAWVDQGARETPNGPPAPPPWEAPLELQRPALPPKVWSAWTSPIDLVVASYLKEHKISEPRLVTDEVFARRAYLDVWGLPPAPAELQAFRTDRSPKKRETLVATLLADYDKYAENWMTYWNDLLRNEDGASYYAESAADSRTSITPWLLGALKANLPYDQFVTKLLNPGGPGDPAGFLIGVNWRGETSEAVKPYMQAAQNTAQLFLGINLKCASCHDSFVNRWKLKDTYSLAALFSSDEVGPKLQLFRCDVARDEYATPAFLYPKLNREPASGSLADRRAAAAAMFTDPRNGRLARTVVNRIWLKLIGYGIVAIPDEMDGKPWSPVLLDLLASDFVEHGYDLKRLIGNILNSRAYQMPAVARPGEPPPARTYVFRGPEVRRMTAEQFIDAVGAVTGEWSKSAAGRGAVRTQPNPAALAPSQQTAIAGMNTTVAAFSQKLTEAQTALTAATFALPPNNSLIQARTEAVAAAELALALARAEVFTAIQATGYKLTPAQKSPLLQTSGRGITTPALVPTQSYVREWRATSSFLTRAMGRPIRDQVTSTRSSVATTVEALELVNGELLTKRLQAAANKLLGRGADPAPLYLAVVDGPAAPARSFDVDISQVGKLYLATQDAGTTLTDQALPAWGRVELVGPKGTIPLSQLQPATEEGVRTGSGPIDFTGEPTVGLRVKNSSVLTYDIAGRGFTRIRGVVALEKPEPLVLPSVAANPPAPTGPKPPLTIVPAATPQVRFAIYDSEPGPATPILAGPLPTVTKISEAPTLIDRVFRYGLGRTPSAAERRLAEDALKDSKDPGKISAEGLADLLWAVVMKPEFQLIY